MTSVRRNLITGEPVLYAPERAGRPNAFAHDAIEVCPFCPGHESMTPAEVARIERGGKWTARAFPNKYPASPRHEVIVETAVHDAPFQSIDNAAAVVRLYIARYHDMAHHSGIAYASLFKNHGMMAGASLDHPHSQLLGSSEVPPRIARESAAFDAARSCPLCAPIREGVISDRRYFVWFAPRGSTMTYQQWIVPKRHVSQPDALSDAELDELAALLQSAAAAMTTIAPSYNWSFVSFPMTSRGHFYLDLFPRMTPIAGYELGTQMFIQIVDPSAAAERLRKGRMSS